MASFDPTTGRIGGFRIVRMLAHGEHCVTVLAHAAGEAVVVRVFTGTEGLQRAEQMIRVSDALRSAHPSARGHLAVTMDVSTVADGDLALIAPAVTGPRLTTLLNQRNGTLTLGEAITVLAPVALVLREAHRVGVTGVGLDAADIRVSNAGVPVMTRLHGALAGPALPERFRNSEAAYAADDEAMRRLGRRLGSAMEPDDRSRLARALEHNGIRREHELFDLAPPRPLLMDAQRLTISQGPRGGGLTPQEFVTPPTPAPLSPSVDDPSPAQLSDSLLVSTTLRLIESWGLPVSITALVRRMSDSLLGRIAHVTATLQRRQTAPRWGRARLIALGGGGVIALLAAVSLTAVAGGNADDDRHLAQPAADTRVPPPGEDIRRGSPETVLEPADTEWQTIARELAERWVHCRATLAAQQVDNGHACVASVVQAGSPAATRIFTVMADRDPVTEWARADGSVVVIERMGAAVVIDLMSKQSTTASLLIVRSEAGWRIRDVLV